MNTLTAESLLDFAEGVGPRLRGLEAKAAFEQLEQQYDELQRALQWFIDQGSANEVFRLAGALVVFWMATKRLEEGVAWFDRALTLPGGSDALRGRAWAAGRYRPRFIQLISGRIGTPHARPPIP